MLNKTEFKPHAILLSETTLDSAYPNAHFDLERHHIYRKDRAKGGGGLRHIFHQR